KTFVSTSNGDIVEIAEIKLNKQNGTLTFLMHRASPDAADPNYRKKVGRKITVRSAEKLEGEEQSVSAHLIMSTTPLQSGDYSVFLEEIPGISLSLIQPIFSRALNEYKYSFKDKKGKDDETYTVLKSIGVKDETVSNALKGGAFGYITLVRPARSKFID